MAVENNTSTSTSFSYLQYKNKVSGLVSGMDIDSIMEKLMKAESSQMEKLQQQKTKYEWKRDAYRDVNTKLSTFEKNAFSDYGLKSSWNMKDVTTSNNAVSAVATASANGTLNITEAQVSTAGQQVLTMGESKATLAEIGFSMENAKAKYTVNGETKTIAYSASDSIDDFAKKLNATGDFKAEVKVASDGTQSLSVTASKDVKMQDETGVYSSAFANKLGLSSTNGTIAANTTATKTFQTKAITADSTISSLGLSKGEFTIGAINDKGEYAEKTIKYEATDKISDIMSKINSSGVGVTALASGGKLSFTANTEGTGSKGSIYIAQKADNSGSTDTNNLFGKLGVQLGSNGELASGSNGYVVANGVKIEGTSNKYTISGYQVTLNKNISASDAPSKVSSTTDTDKIVDKVKKFVESYNELIADLGKRTSEKKKVGYAPLTDAQKAEMSKDEIEKWEVAAKQGLLKGDSTINKVLSDLRSTLSTYGSGSEDMLAKIGITTSKTYSENGKLEIDEDKLKAALTNDPDVVSRIFTGDGQNEGIVSKMRATAQNAVATIKKTAGSADSASDVTYSLGKTITSLDTKIDDWKDRLKGIEERYWKQFSAMETAIQKANSQSSIFAQ